MNENSSSSLNSSSTSAEGDGASSSSLKRSLRNRSAGAGAGGGTGAETDARSAAAAAAASATAARVTRTGKIARLPQVIRQRLNERLADGEPQQLLVAWLNEHAVVRERLERFHGGRLITEQNLSDWKAGGFRDWERHQESRGMLREFLNEAEELSAELDEGDLLEKATASVALALMQLMRDAMAGNPRPEERQAVLQIARELDRMRRVGHEGQRVRLLVERAQAEKKPILPGRPEYDDRVLLKAEREIKEFHTWLRQEAEALRAEYVTGMESRALAPERRQYIEEFFDRHALELADVSVAVLPRWQEPNARTARKRPNPKRKRGEATATSPVKSTSSGREETPSASGSEPSPDRAAVDGSPG